MKTVARILSAALMATVASTAWAGDKSGEKFRARLSGDAEVPPVETDTSGDFRLSYDDFDGIATFRIRLRDGMRVFMAHIHCAAEGLNGPIAVWLAGRPPAGVAWDIDGKWIDNVTITDADVIPTDCGTTLADLIEAIEDGSAYVNVHTEAFPGGEVRGQITPHGNGRRR